MGRLASLAMPAVGRGCWQAVRIRLAFFLLSGAAYEAHVIGFNPLEEVG